MSNLAQVHIYQGNWDQARESLTQSQLIFAEIGSDDFLPELERRWGEFFLKNGDLEQASEHINRSIELAISQDAKLEWGISMRVLGDIKLAQGEQQVAGQVLNRSLEILNELNSDYEAARTVLSITRLAMQKGEDADQEQFEKAIGTFQKLEAQVDLAEALLLQDQF